MSRAAPNKALHRTAATVIDLPGREATADAAAAELGRSASRGASMSPSDLPRFAALKVLTDRCTGQFCLSPWVGENWITGFLLEGSRFLWGRFRDVNLAARTCSFTPDSLAELVMLRPHQSYPFIDGYWGERAELVLDESRSWKRAVFEASDMLLLPGTGGTSMGTRSSPGEASGGRVVSGGWDHEHCEICNRKIGNGGEQEGFVSKPDAWVCLQCYKAFVVPRSLDFVN